MTITDIIDAFTYGAVAVIKKPPKNTFLDIQLEQ